MCGGRNKSGFERVIITHNYTADIFGRKSLTIHNYTLGNNYTLPDYNFWFFLKDLYTSQKLHDKKYYFSIRFLFAPQRCPPILEFDNKLFYQKKKITYGGREGGLEQQHMTAGWAGRRERERWGYFFFFFDQIEVKFYNFRHGRDGGEHGYKQRLALKYKGPSTQCACKYFDDIHFNELIAFLQKGTL